MIRIEMTPEELATVTEVLRRPGAGVTVQASSLTTGRISGKQGIVSWGAGYRYDGGRLTVTGDGVLGGKIEQEVGDRLRKGLARLRAKTDA